MDLFQESSVSFGRASGKRPDPGRIGEYDEDVTATYGTKADGGALGMRLVRLGELDAHREESPNLIGSETGNDIGEAWIML